MRSSDNPDIARGKAAAVAMHDSPGGAEAFAQAGVSGSRRCGADASQVGVRAAHGESIPPQAFQDAMLSWYDAHRRDLPWRARPGERADPYRVWLSEIMLQQTTVKAVIPYFAAFLTRWPDLPALAAAPLDDVLAAWAGLGYYSRARKLHACAMEVYRLGAFPEEEAALLKLPGIGPYTAAAIAAIAFAKPATVVDGNVERVVSRLFAVEEPLPAAKRKLKDFARLLTPQDRPGDFAQAMMDLGATICSPKSPSCLVCPVQVFCSGRKAGIEASLPRRAAKPDRPRREGAAYVAVLRTHGSRALFLRRRAQNGLLGGMMEVPGTVWADGGLSRIAEDDAPFSAVWRKAPGHVEHVFTHFHLTLRVYVAEVYDAPEMAAHGLWVPFGDLTAQALPGVMQKVIARGFEALGLPPLPQRHESGRAARRASSVSTVDRSARPSTRAGRK